MFDAAPLRFMTRMRAETQWRLPHSNRCAMTVLIVGLVLFLGVHSTRIVADGWRSEQIARMGERKWKGLYSLLSIVGFVLLVWGYGIARTQPVVLWASPTWARHLAGPLVLVSFVLLAAANVPRNHIKAWLHHPMVLGVQLWAVAHLLANNTLADLVLFGAFLVWALFSYLAARARDRAARTVYPPGSARGTTIAVVGGLVVWALFAFWAHAFLFGVRPS
jgi:uncharacterized membrane protein